jgi:replication fork clamp-binding protein CrfC
MTNDEINKPSLKEKLYQETLDAFARKQFSPIDNGIGSWEDLNEVYIKYSEAKEKWKPYFKDIENAVKLAVDKTYDKARSEALADFCKELEEILYTDKAFHHAFLDNADYIALKQTKGIE